MLNEVVASASVVKTEVGLNQVNLVQNSVSTSDETTTAKEST